MDTGSISIKESDIDMYKISETSLTISTALIFCVIFFSTAITTEALPSILLIRQTISDLLFLINVSAFDFNSLIAKSSNITYSKLIPLIVSLTELIFLVI